MANAAKKNASGKNSNSKRRSYSTFKNALLGKDEIYEGTIKNVDHLQNKMIGEYYDIKTPSGLGTFEIPISIFEKEKIHMPHFPRKRGITFKIDDKTKKIYNMKLGPPQLINDETETKSIKLSGILEVYGKDYESSYNNSLYTIAFVNPFTKRKTGEMIIETIYLGFNPSRNIRKIKSDDFVEFTLNYIEETTAGQHSYLDVVNIKELEIEGKVRIFSIIGHSSQCDKGCISAYKEAENAANNVANKAQRKSVLASSLSELHNAQRELNVAKIRKGKLLTLVCPRGTIDMNQYNDKLEVLHMQSFGRSGLLEFNPIFYNLLDRKKDLMKKVVLAKNKLHFSHLNNMVDSFDLHHIYNVGLKQEYSSQQLTDFIKYKKDENGELNKLPNININFYPSNDGSVPMGIFELTESRFLGRGSIPYLGMLGPMQAYIQSFTNRFRSNPKDSFPNELKNVLNALLLPAACDNLSLMAQDPDIIPLISQIDSLERDPTYEDVVIHNEKFFRKYLNNDKNLMDRNIYASLDINIKDILDYIYSLVEPDQKIIIITNVCRSVSGIPWTRTLFNPVIDPLVSPNTQTEIRKIREREVGHKKKSKKHYLKKKKKNKKKSKTTKT